MTKIREVFTPMIDEAARAFLQKTLIARLSVVDGDGCPHTVPVWFMLDGDDVVFISARDTRKVGYIGANPKGAVIIGGDSGDEAGYLIKGTLAIEEDPDGVWLKKLTFRYEEPALAAQHVAEWAPLDIVVIRLRPNKVIKVA